MQSLSFLALATFWLTSTESGDSSIQGECAIHSVVNADNVVNLTGNNACTDNSNNTLTSEASFIDMSSPAPKVIGELGEDMGVPQNIDPRQAQATLDRLEEARYYMQNEVMVEAKYEPVRSLCQNKHESCTFWSTIGECDNNPGWMKVHCGPVCRSCEMLHIDTRCPVDPEAFDSWYPGDLNKMFERVAYSPEYQQYEPVVVSKPPRPWMLMFENAISDEEAERLIELGGQKGYERSADVGDRQEDGTYTLNVNSGRTSTNAWCVKECLEDPIAQRVMDRIENITGIPETNSENLQLLRYEEGQFYNTHSDYIAYQKERPTGVRILTFYIYLTDVEEGGAPTFPV